MQLLLFTITKYSYCAIFIALGLGILGLPIPDETLMAYAGFLAFQGKMNYLLTIMAAFLGTSCGVTIGYSLGRTFGNPFIKKYADRMHVHPNDIREAEKFYNKYGRFALFIGYFIPGIRHLTAIFAGTSLMPYGTFALFAYTGGFLWTIILVNIGYLLGEKWQYVYMYSHRFIISLIILSVIALSIGIYWKKVKMKKNTDGK
jgi:membrane protein DedA with SNARE-associated domain